MSDNTWWTLLVVIRCKHTMTTTSQVIPMISTEDQCHIILGEIQSMFKVDDYAVTGVCFQR